MDNHHLLEHAKRELALWRQPRVQWQFEVSSLAQELLARWAKSGAMREILLTTCRVVEVLLQDGLLTPLQGTEEEWGEPFAEDTEGRPIRQNRRWASVFTDGQKSWDTNMFQYVQPDGVTYIDPVRAAVENPITFPYTPTTRRIDVDRNGNAAWRPGRG